jgi:rod shape-determining protein RodA
MNATLRRYLRYTSWPIIASMLALMVMGVLAVRASELAEGELTGFAARQVVYACVALGAFVAATVVPYQRIGRLAYPLFAGTLALLVLVFFLPAIRHAHRWIVLGPIQVQPSEIAKVTYVILLAWYLRYRDNYRRLRGLVVPLLLTLIPLGLILREPDLGTSLLLLPTLYFMLFMAGAKWRHLLGTVALATALVFLPVPRKVTSAMSPAEAADRKALAYWTGRRGRGEYVVSAAPLSLMEIHQLRRIDGWLRQGQAKLAAGRGYQQDKSKTTLAAGGATGWPRSRDADTYLALLPDDHTDFIFSVVGGKWGFAGCAFVLGLYAVIFLFGIEIATVTYDPFGRLLAVGVLALLLAQIFINVGMTMGLMPITGMTLPLVSYGGSSLVVNCAALGLLVNVGQRRPILLGRRPFEHGEKRERPLAVRKMAEEPRTSFAGERPRAAAGTRRPATSRED